MTDIDVAPRVAAPEAHPAHLTWRTLVCVLGTIASVMALPWFPYSPIVGVSTLALTMVAYHRDAAWRLSFIGCVILFFAHCTLTWESMLP